MIPANFIQDPKLNFFAFSIIKAWTKRFWGISKRAPNWSIPFDLDTVPTVSKRGFRFCVFAGVTKNPGSEPQTLRLAGFPPVFENPLIFIGASFLQNFYNFLKILPFFLVGSDFRPPLHPMPNPARFDTGSHLFWTPSFFQAWTKWSSTIWRNYSLRAMLPRSSKNWR